MPGCPRMGAACAATLAAHRVDGAVLPLTIGTSTAAREPDRLYRLFYEHLEKLDAWALGLRSTLCW